MILPPEALFRHRLPPAPKFVGREVELRLLHDAWKSGFRGVLALVGLGGAGKTALAARFLEELAGAPGAPRPAGLLVWSFYQEPDADVFLQETYRYFSRVGASVAPAKGTGLLHLLRECLSSGGRYLLVLDGLERVQQSTGTGTAIHGQIEDPLLRGLLTRVAEGLGNTAVLITSRFPLPDLQPSPGGGFRCVDVHGLDRSAAEELLRHRGVQGDPEAIRELIESYGAHALTLDHLGGLIGQFLDGDPRRAPEAPTLAEPSSDRQALRLARLLHAYEDYLPPAELALLCRLSFLRRPTSEEQILQMFLCSPPVHARTSREIADIFVTQPGLDRYLGLHMAREQGLGLDHIELLCEQADSLLERKDGVAAQEAAREALDRASAERCQFAWGAAEAGHVLGKALCACQQWSDARAALQQALATRRQIGDPRAEITQDLLGSIPG